MRQQSDLVQAIAITNEILQVLQDREFERVSELELQRQSLIRQVFTDSLQKLDLIKVRNLQSLNQQVVEKLNEIKQSVVFEQARIRNAAKASRAYQSNHPTAK